MTYSMENHWVATLEKVQPNFPFGVKLRMCPSGQDGSDSGRRTAEAEEADATSDEGRRPSDDK